MPRRSKLHVIYIVTLILLLSNTTSKALGIEDVKYPKLTLKALKVDSKINIDGELDETAWSRADIATGFTTYSPTIGKAAADETEVRVTYDRSAIYIAAKMYTPIEEVFKNLSERDNSGNSDCISILISPFNDNQNYLQFSVTAANVQRDVIITNDNDDSSWDAVWTSEVEIYETYWVAEVKIPYSALRFPKEQVESWGINFMREDQKNRETSVWNPVDRSLSSWTNQSGNLKGVSVERPPLRLELYPYLSGSVVTDADNRVVGYGGGLDFKYGISSSYTLDVTLIPDFSQTKSDKEVLNLSPYETSYSENRPFFNEGTELFSKTGILYSRRIGERPINYYSADNDLSESEYLIENPNSTDLVNATKISGRGEKGTGLGFLNAITSSSKAVVKDSITGESREVITQGTTNYNMVVYDQTFMKYSSFNIANSNKHDFHYDRNENVTSGIFTYLGKRNIDEFVVDGKYSTINEKSNNISEGYYLASSYRVMTGNFRPLLYVGFISDDYDINGLGYNSYNNRIKYIGSLDYMEFKPTNIFLNWSVDCKYSHYREYVDNKFSSEKIGVDFYSKLIGYTNLSCELDFSTRRTNDYKETRTIDRYFTVPKYVSFGGYVSTNYAKPIAVDLSGSYKSFNSSLEELGYDLSDRYWAELEGRFRLNDKFLICPSVVSAVAEREVGYVETLESDTIIFGQRSNKNRTYSLDLSYIFTNKMHLSLNARHYWSRVGYNQLYSLNSDGSLSDNNTATCNDINYNALNLDLNYSWNFAGGSFFTLVWKCNIAESESVLPSSYSENLECIGEYTPTNTYSMKVTYYIDYGMVKNLLKG